MTQTLTPTLEIDSERLDQFVGRFAADLGAVPNYVGNLVQHWIPALDGVEVKLPSPPVEARRG